MDYRHHIHQLQQQEQEQQVDLEVVGRHALLFDDDTTSAFINSSDALVPWSGGDPSLLIDRYDVRHLLQRLPPPRASRKQLQQEDDGLEPDGVSRADLDLERYRDLEGGGDGGGEEDEEAKENTEVAKSSAYHTVPFSYAASGNLKGHDSGLEYSGYQPPFPVPEHLLSNLPPTEKVHRIISRTAKFVNEHGGQSEIILRVKQGGNPTFGFLMPDHELHAYFRFLVDHPELLKGVTDSADREEGKKTSASVGNELPVTGGALSLLGSMYGSGDDEGGVQDNLELKETRGKNGEDVTCATLPCRSEIPFSSLSEKAKIAMKLPTAALEKPLQAKKSRSSTVTAGPAKSKTKETSAGSVDLFISRPETNTSDLGALILEPPSSLKRMMDKTVEFILKNGKEFEASLIEQDKMNEKFPFLRPSSQYHSYYLKVLQDTRESKLPRKNISDHRNLSVQHVRSTTEVRETASDGSLSNARSMMNQFEGSYQLDRKEKFRMVIGGARKDASTSSSKPSKPSGLSAEEAAAIVMAATRGLSSKAISDIASKTSVDDTVLVPKVIDGLCSSSLGSFPSLPGYNPLTRAVPGGKAGSSLPGGFSHDTGKPGKDGCNTASGVLVANAIAKTVAWEADSSDACLTKEHKLKAERLKRAKMFAAMIKGGKHNTRELSPAIVTHGGSEMAAASSVFSGQESDLAGREREGLSVPVDAEISDSGEKVHEKTSTYDCRKEHSLEKDESGLRHREEDLNGEHKHSRKRHRSRHSSHSSRHDHKHKRHTSHRHKHHASSEDEDLHSSRDKQKQKHHSSSKHKHQGSGEDELMNRKRSESRHRHEHHGSSDNENQERKASRRHRKKSRKEENQNLEKKDDLCTSNLSKQVSLNSSNDVQEVAQPLALEAPSSVATEVPDDLRAKIRAMLLETM